MRRGKRGGVTIVRRSENGKVAGGTGQNSAEAYGIEDSVLAYFVAVTA